VVAELLGSCDFTDALVVIAAVASLAPSVDTTELFLEDGVPDRTGASDPKESLLSLRSDPSFTAFSLSGVLGTGATVIHDLIGCRWDCT